MEDFNAEEARRITNNYYVPELEEILRKIRSQATAGNDAIFVYDSVQRKTIQALEKLGFKLTPEKEAIIIQW